MPAEQNNPETQPLERKLATILSADVAEYSRLMNEDEEQTLRTFRGHKQVFESLVAMHRGRIFNTAGDAILAEFNSAVEAVRCATDIQAALRTRNDQLQPSRQVRFRIGINLGDVMLQGQDLMGDGVNVAARLQTAAEPGGICISGSVHDQIRNKLSLSFQSLGERSFKNIPQPVRTFSITESEGQGALPSPAATSDSKSAKGSSARWIAAAIVLLVAGGAYWAYARNQSGKSLPPTSPAAASQPAPVTAAPPVTDHAAPAAQPNSVPPTAPPEPRKATPATSRSTPPSTPADSPKLTPAAAATPASAPSSSPDDGFYVGPVCYGKTKAEPQRCHRAEGTVAAGKITGKWPVGQETGITMFLAGEVSPSGDVKIEMHSEKPDGFRVATIDLTGTLRDGQLDAAGKFRMGRSATLNWHKNRRASH
jgi:adenylate cyclase